MQQLDLKMQLGAAQHRCAIGSSWLPVHGCVLGTAGTALGLVAAEGHATSWGPLTLLGSL